MISLLLGAGASTALTDNLDRNPYDYALEKEQHEAAKLLGHIKRADQKEDEGADNTGEINLTFDRMDFRDGQQPNDVKKPPVRPSVAAKRHADMLKKKADEIQARIDRANNKGAGGKRDNPPEGPPLQDMKDRAGRFKKDMAANNRAGGAPKPSKVGKKEQNKWVDPGSNSSDGGGDGDDGSCSSPQEVKDFLEKELETITGSFPDETHETRASLMHQYSCSFSFPPPPPPQRLLRLLLLLLLPPIFLCRLVSKLGWKQTITNFGFKKLESRLS